MLASYILERERPHLYDRCAVVFGDIVKDEYVELPPTSPGPVDFQTRPLVFGPWGAL